MKPYSATYYSFYFKIWPYSFQQSIIRGDVLGTEEYYTCMKKILNKFPADGMNMTVMWKKFAYLDYCIS